MKVAIILYSYDYRPAITPPGLYSIGESMMSYIWMHE